MQRASRTSGLCAITPIALLVLVLLISGTANAQLVEDSDAGGAVWKYFRGSVPATDGFRESLGWTGTAPFVSSAQLNATLYRGGSKVAQPFQWDDGWNFRYPYVGYLVCPAPNQVLVGIHGHATGIVRRLGGICVEVDSDGHWVGSPFHAITRRTYKHPEEGWKKWQLTPPVVMPDKNRLPQAFGQATGTRFEELCSPGHAITGFQGRAGWSLDRLQMRCGRLDDGLGTAIPASTHWLTVGGSGGSAFSRQECAGNTVAKRIKMTFRHVVDIREVEAHRTRPAQLKLYCGSTDTGRPEVVAFEARWYYSTDHTAAPGDVGFRDGRDEICWTAAVKIPGWSAGTLQTIHVETGAVSQRDPGRQRIGGVVKLEGCENAPTGAMQKVREEDCPSCRTPEALATALGTGFEIKFSSLTDAYDRYVVSSTLVTSDSKGHFVRDSSVQDFIDEWKEFVDTWTNGDGVPYSALQTVDPVFGTTLWPRFLSYQQITDHRDVGPTFGRIDIGQRLYPGHDDPATGLFDGVPMKIGTFPWE